MTRSGEVVTEGREVEASVGCCIAAVWRRWDDSDSAGVDRSGDA